MSPAEWHPILTAQEGPTGTWRMLDPDGRVYGVIEIRRLNNEIRYRAKLGDEVIGWATSLRLATHRTHLEHMRRNGARRGAPNAPY
ncbi:hypothetical protein [Microbacterium rhizomatis]|uniref:Uncharacterized protein n=1 Tax=Microbacterium rhizomatis TaxID=1631477 RepID=A0A5J5J6G2_9MICO|nr:hypothetical protein [Microbacterium rhizomatis]KAA9110373.1 hypothetical protein F6B43_01375 [Microbacterium rhizomatis]